MSLYIVLLLVLLFQVLSIRYGQISIFLIELLQIARLNRCNVVAV